MNNNIENMVQINLKEKIEKSGIPIGFNCEEKKLLVDTDFSHRLVIGCIGSGKTQAITLPMLKMMIKAEESFVVTDSLGEIYNQVGGILKEEGYETIIINFKDYQYGNHWNPFSDIVFCYQEKDDKKTEELLYSLTKKLFLNTRETNDPFWDNSAAAYFMGLVYLLLEEEKPITFQSIYNLSQEGHEQVEDISYFKRYYEKDDKRLSYFYLSNILNAPTETRQSILSVFYQKINPFIVNGDFVEMMNITDFNSNDFGKRKKALFIILPEHFRNVVLVSVLLKQLYENNLENNRPFHFLLEDFHQLEEIESFSSLLENARRRNICFTVMTPSFQTFYEKYGDQEGKKIKDIFSTLLYLLSNDIYTIKEVADTGTTSKQKEKEAPFPTERELRTLDYWEGIFLKSRNLPKRIKLKPDYEMEWNFKRSIVELHPHEPVIIPKFEFQNFVLSR